MRRSPRILMLSLSLASVLTGCGASSNFNQIWGKDEGTDTLFIEAKAAYDRGDFDDAEGKVNKILARSPDNEAAAVLLGYISLSQAGIDPYQLARSLIGLETEKTTTTTTPTTLADDTETKSSDAASTLQALSSLVNLSDEDFVSLSDNKRFDNNGAPNLFGDSNPIFVPAKVTDELRAKVTVLDRLNKSMKAVCRFVSADVLSEDPRDKAADCATADDSVPRHNAAKAHFLWAFSHLAETIVYQSVLLYQSANNVETNFQTGATIVNNANVTDAAGINQFVLDVTEVTNAVEVVFDTSEGSMMQATLRGLTSVRLAFNQIPGLPEKIKQRIDNVLTKIEQVGEKFGGGTDSNLKALKGQLTEKFAKTMGKKIEGAIGSYLEGTPVDNYAQLEQLKQDGTISQEVLDNVTSMCSSYDNLTGSLDPEKKDSAKPATCP